MTAQFAQFKDKVCVVTGAASGIGRATAVRLAQAGAAVAISDIDADGLEETRRMIDGATTNRLLVDRLDVSDGDAIIAYAETVRQSLGDADYLFNIAGLTRVGVFEDTPLSSYEKIMDVNYWGVVRMTKAFLPQLIETRGGLVNISSIFGMIGFAGQAHYCASKFAVRGFSETIAQELAGKGVRVTSVHPGGVATGIARNAVVDAMPPEVGDKAEIESRFNKAAITSPERAADIILSGAARGKRQVLVGPDARIISFVQRLFPESYAGIIARLRPRGA